MKKVIATGKSIEEAIQVALSKLGVTREQVDIHVLTQPSRGLFGLIGARDAEIEAVVKEEPVPANFKEVDKEKKRETTEIVSKSLEEAQDFLAEVVRLMGISAEITVTKDKDGYYVFQMEGDKMGILIGRRGQTLDSLQYLVNLVANKNSDDFIRIVLDAEDYRARRKETLEKLADRLARQVIRERSISELEPMPAHERKIIHTYLQGHPKVGTRSEGHEPNRRLVIFYKK